MAQDNTTRLDEIQAMIDSIRSDHDKFYVKGNNAAGVRVRGGLQDIVEAAKSMRKEIQSIKNEKKAKAGTKKEG